MKSAPATSRQPGPTLVPLLTRAELRLPDDPFLLTRFEEFYREVVRQKARLNGYAAPSASSAQEIQKILAEFLIEQESQVERTGTLLGAEMYRQAQRVMASLADEIFQAYSWPHGATWPSLEAELFEAGDPHGLAPGGQCLRKLDLLLRQDDPVYRELATVYFYALALGKPGDQDAADYLAALRKMISAPLESRQVFPQSYAHTLAENRITFLPSPAKWIWVLASIVVAWFAISWVLWVSVSTPVESQLHEIRKMLRP